MPKLRRLPATGQSLAPVALGHAQPQSGGPLPRRNTRPGSGGQAQQRALPWRLPVSIERRGVCKLEVANCDFKLGRGRGPQRRAISRSSQKQWNFTKMEIQGEELKPVLQRNGCDPDIIAWNGPAFPSQIHIHLRVPQRGLFGYVQDANRWLAQELRQLCGVLRPTISGPESAVQLTQDDGWNSDGLRSPHHIEYRLVSSQQGRVGRRVE